MVPTVVEESQVVWLLQEATEYRVRAQASGLTSARLDALPLPRLDGQTARLYVGHWTSSARALLVESNEGKTEQRVRIIPREEKLDESAWLEMITELEQWLPGISVGPSGGTIGGLSLNGSATSGLCAMALLPLVPGLLRALRTIARAPRERTIDLIEHVPPRAVRRASPRALAWLSRHPDAATAVDAWRSLERPGPEPLLQRDSTCEDLDHPVNRYVVWAVRKAARTLDALADRLGKTSRRRGIDHDTQQWCEARAKAANLGAHEVRASLRHSGFRYIRPAPPTAAALLTLQDDPIYSRFHRLVRPFLDPRHAQDAEDERTPARPSYELYELWTFFKVVTRLSADCSDWTQTWHHKGSETSAEVIGNGSWVEFRQGDERLEVHFNRTFQGYLRRKRDTPYSISAERRPDIIVGSARGDGRKRWLFLDAKYRVSRSALGDAFSSIHIYRDSLRWPAMGDACKGGFLLTPAQTEEAAPWYEQRFLQKHRCGCLRVRPGVPEDLDRLVGTVRQLLEFG